ncbi:hypothetical protein [Serratia fonticola]|uniref:hypothetical protein n=1 Tax=Serratia fonticola TaxID=47917 RepID=UPI0034C61FFC
MKEVKIGLIIITAIAVSIALPTFNKEHVIDFGTSSDIFIALCNLAMAGAAIFAAVSAKNWLENKAKDLSFNKAIEIIATFDSLKSQLDRFHFEIINLKNNLNPKVTQHLTHKLNDLTYNVSSFIRKINNTTYLGFEMNLEIKNTISLPLQDYVNTAWVHIDFYETYAGMTKFLRNTSIDKDQTIKLNALFEETNNSVQALNVDLRKIFTFKV